MNLKLKMKILEKYRTQADFAKVTGTHETIVSRVINERQKLSPVDQELWAKKLGTQPEDIFPKQ